MATVRITFLVVWFVGVAVNARLSYARRHGVPARPHAQRALQAERILREERGRR
jgi:hypothetical protein